MSSSSTKQLSILVLRSAQDEWTDFHNWVNDHACVRVVDNYQDAVKALHDTPFDLLVCDPAQLIAPDRVEGPGARSTLVATTSQGFAIVDGDGRLQWANQTMMEFPEYVRDRVAQLSLEAFGRFLAEGAERPGRQRARRFSIECDESVFDLSVTPIADREHNVTRVAAVVWDVTHSKSLREKIDAIDKAAEELVSFDAEQITRLDAQQRLDLIEQKVIRYTHELMSFDHFTVHLLDKKTNKLELVLSSGMPSEVQEIPIYARQEGNGICGYVAASGRSYMCPDVEKDERYIAGIPGAKSCLAAPLMLHHEVIGVFNVESHELAAFTEEDRQFAELFAHHIAVALHILNLLVSERHQTTGQLASDVMAEITGPLNDILTDVGNLLDDYIGHDELRHRLNQISDNGVRIRDAIRQVTSRRPGLIDRHRSTASVRFDPILSGRKILVADDEEVIRETVRDVLRSYGCEVDSVGDGDVAIAAIREKEFDLVLSDIKMPTGNGYEVFSAAKDRNKDCPVILMTGFGYDPNHAIVRARREGLAAVLFKPFKVEQLLGEIRTAIRATPAGS